MARLISRFGAALKAFRDTIAHPGGYVPPGNIPGRHGLGGRNITFVPMDGNGAILPLGGQGYACGAAWENSAVAIGLGWISDNFSQADLVVQGRSVAPDEDDAPDEWEAIADHPMIALLEDPTPDFGVYDFYNLFDGAILSAKCDGNGYWLKARDATDQVRELWWVPHTCMEPYRRDPLAPEYLYRYTVHVPGLPNPIVRDFEPRDVVHFRNGPPDPKNDLKACSPLKRCFREVMSDDQVAEYTAAILHNRGVPGMLAIFDDDAVLDEDIADEIKDRLKRSFNGENRGDTAVLRGPVKFEFPAFSPDQLALTEISRIPEARICAALGVPPMVIDLSVGETQKSYANQAQATRKAWTNLASFQGRMAEALYRQLLPDFEEDRKQYRVAWDYSHVEALQEDRDARSKRAVFEFQGGLIHKNEARAEIGKPPVPGGDDVWWAGKNPNEGAAMAPAAGGGAGSGQGGEAAKPKALTRSGDDIDGNGAGNVRDYRSGQGRPIGGVALAKLPAAPGDRGYRDLGAGKITGVGGSLQQGVSGIHPVPGGRLDLPTDRRPVGTPEFAPGPAELDALAYRVLKQFAEATHAADPDDRRGPGGRDQGVILDASGRPLKSGGERIGGDGPTDRGGDQPPQPPFWAADRQADGPDVPGDGGGHPGLAGGLVVPLSGDDGGGAAGSLALHSGPGDGACPADAGVSPGVGGQDPGEPGPGRVGDGGGEGVDGEPAGE